MKTNDLRIGNCVLYGYVPHKIVSLTKVDASLENLRNNTYIDLNNISFEKVKPIELTEEVLVNIGFKKGDTSPRYQRYYLEVCGNGQSLFLNYDFYYDEQRRLKIIFRNLDGVENEFKKYDIKYIHQLQNAYNLLTNEELEVEL